MLPNVVAACVFGPVAGHYYERTKNLWGASVPHDIGDFIAVGLPLLF